jgi:glutamyl-tRNA reductase
MLQDLRIVHRRKPAIFAETHAALVWSTCLRSLAFGGGSGDANDEIYEHAEAYQFLLEVVCGLKSPIVGETEVFGQFKAFSQKWVMAEPKRATLVQKLLSDAKAIRTEHLTGLGVQSYGSWVRGRVKSARVHFLGAGQLVQEIYPYLHKQERDLALHVRDLFKASNFASPCYALGERAFDHGALIIAAPMSAREIEEWLAGKTLEHLIDLRDNSALDPVNVAHGTKVHLLGDIFSEIEKTRAGLASRLERVRAEIAERAKTLASQSLLRPQGWDDLCA